MELVIFGLINVIILVIIVIAIVDYERKRKQKSQQSYSKDEIIAYNPHNGKAIYKSQVNIISYNPNTGVPIFEYKDKVVGYNPYNGEPIFENQTQELPKEHPVKKELSEEEKTKISNSILMITGALLVVFASVIFLVSAWESIPNILKTLILVFIQMLFYLFGNICEKKLNIPKVSKLFNYLMYSFIPIILLSLSFFELVGDFFSISGEGYNWFFCLSFLLTDIIYKICGKLKKDIFLKRASLFAELIAIVFCFSNFGEPYFLLFALVIHNIIMYILLQGNYLDKKAYKSLNTFYSYLLIPMVGLCSVGYEELKYSIILLLLSGLFFYRVSKEEQEIQSQPYIISFFLTYFLAIKNIQVLDIFPYIIYITALFPILCLTEVIKSQQTKTTISNLVSIVGLIITGLSIINAEKTLVFLSTIAISFILYLVMYIKTKKDYYKLITYILFSVTLFSICYITEASEIAKYILMVVPILVYCIEELITGLKDKYSKIFIVGSLCIESIILTSRLPILIPLILMISYVKKEKIAEDVLTIPMFYSLSIFFDITSSILILPVVGFIMTIIYTLFSIDKEKNNIYLIFSFITLAVTCSYCELDSILICILFFIWSIVNYFFNKEKKVFSLSSLFSLLGVYIFSLEHLDIELYSLYVLGIFISSMIVTRVIFEFKNKNFHILESIIICIITLILSFVIVDVVDGLILIFILLILAITSYIKKYIHYLYGYIISMIGCILILSSEYLKDIPWYVYILLVGLALIIFALFDEQRKQKKISENSFPDEQKK